MSQSIRKKLLDNSTVANTTLNSDYIDITNHSGCGIQVDLAGGAIAGTVKVQASNTSLVWVDVAGASSAVAAAGSFFFNISQMYHGHLRVVVISTNANTMTCNCYALAKEA